MTVQDLGKSCIELVQDAGSLQSNPADSYARRDLTEHARNITEKVCYNFSPITKLLSLYLVRQVTSFETKYLLMTIFCCCCTCICSNLYSR